MELDSCNMKKCMVLEVGYYFYLILEYQQMHINKIKISLMSNLKRVNKSFGSKVLYRLISMSFMIISQLFPYNVNCGSLLHLKYLYILYKGFLAVRKGLWISEVTRSFVMALWPVPISIISLSIINLNAIRKIY